MKLSTLTLTLGLFNHTKQHAVSVTVESYDLAQWLEDSTEELSLECLEIDGIGFDTVKSFGDLAELVMWLENQDCIDLDQVSDFLDLFRLEDLSLYEDMHTGWDDFSEYAQDFADECLLSDLSDEITQYFDYASFERDLGFGYTIGRYVWHNS